MDKKAQIAYVQYVLFSFSSQIHLRHLLRLKYNTNIAIEIFRKPANTAD